MTRYLTVVWVLATELMMGSGRSLASLGYGYYGICIQIMSKTGGIVELSVVLVGFSSMLLSSTSSGLGPIPLTFCPFTGTINNDLRAEGLLTAVGRVLVIFSPKQVSSACQSPLLNHFVVVRVGTSLLEGSCL